MAPYPLIYRQHIKAPTVGKKNAQSAYAGARFCFFVSSSRRRRSALFKKRCNSVANTAMPRIGEYLSFFRRISRRAAAPHPGKGTGAPPQTPPGGMISPGPPQFAVQGLSWRKGSPSTRCCARNPQAERPGIPDCGGYLSVSVSCRTRSRRPTPSRPAPGRRVKGKISRQGGVVRRCQLYSAPVFGKSMVQTPGQALFVENKAVFNASCCFCLRKKALFQRVVGPRFAKEGRVSTLWGPRSAFRRPGRWMQAAAIHSRR